MFLKTKARLAQRSNIAGIAKDLAALADPLSAVGANSVEMKFRVQSYPTVLAEKVVPPG